MSWPVHGVPSDQGQQLFYDNFQGSQFSPYWTPFNLFPANTLLSPNGNLTQTGGWLGLVSNRGTRTAAGFGLADVIANNTVTPIIGSTTTNQFVFMAWRLVGTNLTQIGNSPGSGGASIRNQNVLFGLFSNSRVGGGVAGLGFQLGITDSTNGVATLDSQREYVAITIDNPMYPSTMPQCFGKPGSGFGGSFLPSAMNLNCTTQDPPMVYSPQNPQLDLSMPHIFAIQASFNPSAGSWAAFEVDNNGWYNVTQKACSCIDANGGVYASLYPAIAEVNGMGSAASGAQPVLPNQSIATFVNYVLVDNYVPTNLPSGNPLPGANPIGPSGLTDTFPNFWVFEAFQLGNGIPTGTANFLMSPLYFGGFILWLITTLALCVPGFILQVKNVFVYGMIAFFSLVGNFIMGVIPLWAMGVGVAIFIGVMVKVLPTRIGDHPAGGIVD